ncbi:MAG: cytidine deaminase [Candidatus Acetothermia bacterium]|jgi:cytidine deaminase|nr:cytidine deaminase [Candidatus Acetothermia bacterium]MDH7505692.1 cytidine deaminase [Candidatus Acetothermia bacterium]
MIGDRELLREACAARIHAYAPYSHHLVGAALLGRSGKIYRGANVENSVNGLSICAERVAVAKAVSEGEREFVKLAVVCGDTGFCRPCGACRQVLFEFAPQIQVVMGNTRGEFEVKSLAELLPAAFDGSSFKRSAS